MLNPKQQRFCTEYASSGNATQAYKKTYGVADDTTAQAAASRLLSDERIKEYLRELSEEFKTESIADVKELQTGLTKIFRGQATTAVLTKGGEVIEVPVSAKDRLKAAEILCRTFGAFISKQELEITNTTPIVIRDNI